MNAFGPMEDRFLAELFIDLVHCLVQFVAAIVKKSGMPDYFN